MPLFGYFPILREMFVWISRFWSNNTTLKVWLMTFELQQVAVMGFIAKKSPRSVLAELFFNRILFTPTHTGMSDIILSFKNHLGLLTIYPQSSSTELIFSWYCIKMPPLRASALMWGLSPMTRKVAAFPCLSDWGLTMEMFCQSGDILETAASHRRVFSHLTGW